MPFPTEPQDSCPQQAPSVFTESIRLASLCGQGLWHYQQSIVEQEVRDTFSLDFWARHHRLEADIARSAKTLSNDSCVEHYLDSLSLLVHMTVQAASLTMFKSTHGQSDINTSAPHQATEQVFLTALPAAQRIVALSAELVQLSYFQVCEHIYFLLSAPSPQCVPLTFQRTSELHGSRALLTIPRSILLFQSFSSIAPTSYASMHTWIRYSRCKLRFRVRWVDYKL